MSAYTLAVLSERSTFSIAFEAPDDGAALEHAGRLITKARVAPGGSVKLILCDGTEIDASERLDAYFDRPRW
jgi:hypothetical protein